MAIRKQDLLFCILDGKRERAERSGVSVTNQPPRVG